MANKSQKARDNARRYFGLTPNDYNLVLHHIDPTLKKRNPERYHEWRPEDLIVMTTEEHSSLHHKGKKYTEETRKKISAANRDKKRSEETKNKMSEAHKLPVVQYTLSGELVRVWESATQAEQEGFNQSNIARVCKGKQKHHKNYIWKYVNDKT